MKINNANNKKNKKIMLILAAIGILSISAIYAVSFPVSGWNSLHYVYNIPSRGNAVGTPIIGKNTTGAQYLSSINNNIYLESRVRDKDGNSGSESTLTAWMPTYRNSGNDNYFDAIGVGQIGAGTNLTKLCSPGYFYLQVRTASSQPSAVRADFTWSL